MGTVVCKFGGSSLADDLQFAQVRRIIESNSRRRLVVPSAPGKRNDADTKITDLLYLCHELARQGLDFSQPFAMVRARYEELAAKLGISLNIGRLLDELNANIDSGASRDYVASRGEYLCGQVISDYLGATFIDAAEVIRFRTDGELDPASHRRIRERVGSSGIFVIPGFYGSDSDGATRTFSRGGSDITGAIVARAVDAEVYENWTDVSGLLMADPGLVPDARPVREITYREVRELAYMGASVFHDEAMFPARAAGIPIHIRNTNRPGDPGTRIVARRELTADLIAGVAGQPAFTMLFIEKAMMNQQKGFGRQVLEVVASHDISYEHTPSGIDTMSVIMRDDQLDGKGERLVDDIQRILQPDRVELLRGLALIATVGEGMSHRIGIAARLFSALADANVNVRVIDQGASEINIIVGVEEADYKHAVRAIYDAFVG